MFLQEKAKQVTQIVCFQYKSGAFFIHICAFFKNPIYGNFICENNNFDIFTGGGGGRDSLTPPPRSTHAYEIIFMRGSLRILAPLDPSMQMR